MIIGQSPAIRRVRDNVATAVLPAIESTIGLGETHRGASDPMGLRILVLGDRGTGKELVATAVAQSLTAERRRIDRKAKVPFEKVNCGAFVETLVVSKLFGYKKGAFTGATRDNLGRFERARGGVLFLDEIGDLVGRAQAALLRAVGDTCEIEPIGDSVVSVPDVHIVAATNRHPKELESDLLDRLDQDTIVMPPLRDRPEDIGPLVTHFSKQRRRNVRLTDEALAAAKTYPWPGNVRELKSMVGWSISRSEGNKVVVDLPLLQGFLRVAGTTKAPWSTRQPGTVPRLASHGKEGAQWRPPGQGGPRPGRRLARRDHHEVHRRKHQRRCGQGRGIPAHLQEVPGQGPSGTRKWIGAAPKLARNIPSGRYLTRPRGLCLQPHPRVHFAVRRASI